MPLLPERLKEIAMRHVLKGAHSPDSQMCVMEMAAYVAGEEWSDSPTCVSPAIAAFLRNWNDSVDYAFRQRLKPYVEKVLDTRTTEEDETTRAWMATDWLVRVHAPAWLTLAGLNERADELRGLPPLTSSEIAVAVQATIEKARGDSAAAWAAAGAAAGAAARAAAGDAARAAAWDAAGAAAWDAAGAAAWDAAGDAARAAAWDAAGAAAWDAAGDAAGAAAGDAARAAAGDAVWDAAWAAAGATLATTVAQLQESAFDLLDNLIAVGRNVI